LNTDLFALLSAHAAWFKEKFGETRPEYYLFPFGSVPNDPTRSTTTLKTAWDSIGMDAGVSCRQHDLRHTAVTKLAEAGVPESTVLSLVGHMSRAMLERHSHFHMAAERAAGESLLGKPNAEKSDGVPTKSPTVANKIVLQ
jgi:integrase